MQVRIGVSKFNDSYADTMLEFVVVAKEGKLYKCEAKDADYGNHVRYYNRKQILAKLEWAAMWDDVAKGRADFWATRKVGDILHYHNSFGKYIRGVVINDGGEMKLKPTAMVGSWDKYDLPSRKRTGEISYPYHADKILNGGPDAAWQPSDGCVYESPTFSGPMGPEAGKDPRKMTPIDLTVPEPTASEMIEIAKEQRLAAIATVISSRYETRLSADEALAEVERLLVA